MHGLFILGTTGEEQSLSYQLRKEMIEQSARINRGRLPLLVCITDTSIVESIRLAQVAADCGADGVVSAPPYYFAPGQPELIIACRRVVDIHPTDAQVGRTDVEHTAFLVLQGGREDVAIGRLGRPGKGAVKGYLGCGNQQG